MSAGHPARHVRGLRRSRPQHPACPARGFYPDRAAAEHAARHRPRVQARPCGRCGGFHLHLTTSTTSTDHTNGAA